MSTLLRYYIVGLVVTFFFHSQDCTAKSDSSSVTNQVWLDYNLNTELRDGVRLYIPMGVRTVFPNSWDRFYVSPYVSYDWPRLIKKNLHYKEQFIGGVGVYYTLNENNPNRLEISPFQGYSISAPNRESLVIKHYLRLEERFEINTDDWVNDFGLRFRYTASAVILFQGDVVRYGKGFYMPVGAEFFWNLIGTEQFNDKFRFTFGLGHKFSNGWKTAFVMGYFYTRGTPGESFHTNDIMYRFRVYHTIKYLVLKSKTLCT